MSAPELVPLGENAFIIRISSVLDRSANAKAVAIAHAIQQAELPGLTDIVPANSSVGVYFENRQSAKEIGKALSRILDREADSPLPTDGHLHEIPVIYNGPDLEAVAAIAGLSIPDVAEIHCAPEYQVFAIGFAPGFAYLGELDARISVPRRPQPRTRVPAGSLAIANLQTAIYPMDTPGGWHLIGTTPTPVFDIRRNPAALFNVGDRVRFVPQ